MSQLNVGEEESGRLWYFGSCVSAVTGSLSGPRKLFKGVIPAQPPEANVNWFSVASPGSAGNFTENAVSPLLLRARAQLRVNTERLAERETLLHRLGSKLNRIVFNSCGNPIIRSANNT